MSKFFQILDLKATSRDAHCHTTWLDYIYMLTPMDFWLSVCQKLAILDDDQAQHFDLTLVDLFSNLPYFQII